MERDETKMRHFFSFFFAVCMCVSGRDGENCWGRHGCAVALVWGVCACVLCEVVVGPVKWMGWMGWVGEWRVVSFKGASTKPKTLSLSHTQPLVSRGVCGTRRGARVLTAGTGRKRKVEVERGSPSLSRSSRLPKKVRALVREPS